jgi:hypothetical protein
MPRTIGELLVWRRLFKPSPPRRPSNGARFRDVSDDRRAEFVARGFKPRHFFPHRLYVLPRCGSDGVKLARSMYGISGADRLRQILLFARGAALDGIPARLFFDDDLVWHQQQLGLPGHVAAANLIVHGRRLLTTARFSDIVQRVSRQREHLTRIEKRFRGWDHMLLNGILSYAVERNLRLIYFPTARGRWPTRIRPGRSSPRCSSGSTITTSSSDSMRSGETDSGWSMSPGIDLVS